MSPTLVKRLMDDVLPRAKDKRLASVVGRLHLEGVLTERECAAGLAYAETAGAYERLKGFPARSARSASFAAGVGKAAIDLDALRRMDPEQADKIESKLRRRVRKAEDRYNDAHDCVAHFGLLAETIVEQVCCADERVNPVHLQGLKAVLAVLADRIFKLPLGAGDKPQGRSTKRKTPADAEALAENACATVEERFTAAGAIAQGYEITDGAKKLRRITVYGVAKGGTVACRIAVEVALPLKPDLIDKELALAARRRGWYPAQSVGQAPFLKVVAGVNAGKPKMVASDELREQLGLNGDAA